MVNFMCQLGWAMGCPDIWLNMILGVFVRVFLDEINVWVGRLGKADCPPQGGWASSNPTKAWVELQGCVRENSLSLPNCFQAGTSNFCLQTQAWTGIYTIGFLCSQVFRLRQQLYLWLPWVSSLPTADLGTCQPPNHVSQFLIINLNLSVSPTGRVQKTYLSFYFILF